MTIRILLADTHASMRESLRGSVFEDAQIVHLERPIEVRESLLRCFRLDAFALETLQVLRCKRDVVALTRLDFEGVGRAGDTHVFCTASIEESVPKWREESARRAAPAG